MDVSSFDRVAAQIPKYSQLLLRLPSSIKAQAFDIHLKVGQPVAVCGKDGVVFLKKNSGVSHAITDDLIRVTKDEMHSVFVQTCSHSVFSHEHEIKHGYISMGFSCRAGVCGTAVVENGSVKSVRDVTSLSFRIPRDMRGCADMLFLSGAEISEGVLIAGEPSSGKTTFLRDVARSLSIGKFTPVRRVAVLDERGELGSDFDLGPCADILRGYPKREAFDIAIRMLSPEFIICDELSSGDLSIAEQSSFTGVPIIASVHASRRDIFKRPLCAKLLRTGAFGVLVCLCGRSQSGKIESVERVTNRENNRGTDDNSEQSVLGLEPLAHAEKKRRGAA